MIILTKEQILSMHTDLINETGGGQGLRDERLLDASLAAPFQTFGGSDLFDSVQRKAARLGFGLTMDHPFIDGNKRIGAHAMLVFLVLNGIELSYTQTELSDMFLSIAAGESSVDDLCEWIGNHAV